MGVSTSEADIFSCLANWLDKRGYSFFVHVPKSHQSIEGYNKLYDKYMSHSISIGSYKPDIIGYTPSNRIFAIEVKGTDDLRKGLGQAISYQRGVDHAYLAADKSKLNRIEDLALSKGIGTYKIDYQLSRVTEKHPYAAEMKDLLYNTRHQLENMSITVNQKSSLLPKYADPLNQLMPVVAIAGHNRTTTNEIGDLVEKTGYPYHSEYKRMIGLAEYLGMIYEENNTYHLSQQGDLGWLLLQGYGVKSVSDLRYLKERVALYKNHPQIATYLRNRFASNPDFRVLLEILYRRNGDNLSIQELCKVLIDNYPNTFLNLVYNSFDDQKIPTTIEQGRGEEIYNSPEILKQAIHSQFISNTVSQFKNLGVLKKKTPIIEPKSDLNPVTDCWYPREFQLI